jgi:class 3 adenylate cyclase
MTTRSWNEARAKKRIDDKIAALPLKDIEIKDYVRDTDLAGLPNGLAYRVDGVHLYADILNLDDMLNQTSVEGETVHRRTLRFLNLHYRAVDRILSETDTIFVDFHNQRLHAVIVKPYDDEVDRVHRAVAIGQLIIDVLAQTAEGDEHPAASVRVGIDTGEALAVNNGRRGHREPLFLGEPANHAAKRACGGASAGVFLTNTARTVLDLAEVNDEDAVALTADEIATSESEASLDVTADSIVTEWQEDLEDNPIGTFEFSGHTPPFKDLDFDNLSVKNSRRQDAAAIYADIDGFTAFVSANIDNDKGAKNVVRALHVLRSELDAVLHEDFSGRKVRFIGDCIHGLLGEGTAQTTDDSKTISTMTLCAGGMRSSFDMAVEQLAKQGIDTTNLGLQIGFEYGPMTATRLGMKGGLVRCSVSRGVLAAEGQQGECRGTETAIGPVAYKSASDAVRSLFGITRKRADLDYATMVDEMSRKLDRVAKAAVLEATSLLKPAAAAAASTGFPNRPMGPSSKPAGFA